MGKKTVSIPAQGFEIVPRGKLLEQQVDLDTAMGIAYERGVGYHKEFHSHARAMLVCPRGACRMRVGLNDAPGRPRVAHAIDSSQILFVPVGILHDDESLSTIYDTLALFPDATRMRELATENALDATETRALREDVVRLRRTRWMDDLVERYFFERILNEVSPTGCRFFLEKQILNELVRILFAPRLRSLAHATREEKDVSLLAEQAQRFIEGHLFEPLGVERVCEHLKVSESTLQRLYGKAFGMKVGEYVKSRRLDEAALLLKKGDYRVSDVCMLVGYADASSFSRSFKARFGTSPQDYAAHPD